MSGKGCNRWNEWYWGVVSQFNSCSINFNILHIYYSYNLSQPIQKKYSPNSPYALHLDLVLLVALQYCFRYSLLCCSFCFLSRVLSKQSGTVFLILGDVLPLGIMFITNVKNNL